MAGNEAAEEYPLTVISFPLYSPRSGSDFFLRNQLSAAGKPEAPVVLVKWNDYAKWVLERVESFPKNQRFVLGQRLSNQVMEVLEILVFPLGVKTVADPVVARRSCHRAGGGKVRSS